MFERFTDRARQVVVFASEEARTLGHDCIGTEHLLLGLLRDEEGVAARVLASYNISLEAVRAQIIRVIGQGDGAVTSGGIPFTERAKQALEMSLSEAVLLGYENVDTEHILLGVVRDDESVAARILVSFDADADKIRGEVIRLATGREPRS